MRFRNLNKTIICPDPDLPDPYGFFGVLTPDSSVFMYGSGSVNKAEDSDPYQNHADPEH
jgi:hypothetical protein